MNKIRKVWFAGMMASIFVTTRIQAQEEAKPADAAQDKVSMSAPAISGYVESTLNWNFTQTGKGKKQKNELRSYDAQPNTFNLNAAHIAINGETTNKKLSYTVEVDGGSDATVNRDSIGAGYVDLQEAYMTYQFTDWLSFTSGKFATFQGIEVIEGPDNPTVSRGYLYGLAEAFTLTGMYFELTPADMLSIKLGGANDWDTMVDSDDKKTFISAIGLDFGNPLSFVLSTFVGGDSVADISVDLTGVTKIADWLDLNFQANYGQKKIQTGASEVTSKWVGAGLQPVFHFSSSFDLGLRYELWNPNEYKSGYTDPTTGNDVKILAHNVTITPTWKPMAGFMIRPELRVDFADKEIFFKDATSKSKTNITGTLGTSVSF